MINFLHLSALLSLTLALCLQRNAKKMNGANISPSFYSFFIFFSIFVFILLLLPFFLFLPSFLSFFPILSFSSSCYFFLLSVLLVFIFVSLCLSLCSYSHSSFSVPPFLFLLFLFLLFQKSAIYSKSSISTTSSIFPNFMPTFSKHDFCSKPNEACIFMLASLSPVMQAIRATNPRWRHSSISMCMSCVPMPRRSMPGAR